MSARFLSVFLLSVVSVFVLMSGCSSPNKVESPLVRTTSGTAMLKILATANSPFSRIADSATVTVSASDMITFTTALTVTDSSITGTITGIPAGSNRLFYVAVYDSLDTVQYRGSTTANVVADSSATVSLSVTRISGAAIVNGVITDGDVISTRGLVAYYPFNGNAKDVSGNGNNGIMNGSTISTQNRFQVNSSALHFDGSNNVFANQIQPIQNTAITAFSFSAWIKFDGMDYLGVGIKLLDIATAGYKVSVEGNRTANTLTFSIWPTATSNRIITSWALIPQQWYNVVGVLNNDSIALYINDSLAGKALAYHSITPTCSLYIGRDLTSNIQPWHGDLDEIRFYNRALSPSEIDLLYHEGGWTGNTVADIDGNVYHTVTIGTQVWTVENLRVTRYNDSTAIPLVTDNAVWGALTTPAYCQYNNRIDPDSIRKWGALYNWFVVDSANVKKIAPAGWHVPTDAEWTTMENYLIANGFNYDGTTTGNKIAKSLAAKTDWASNSIAGAVGMDLTINNRSGFSALPGGFRYSDGTLGEFCGHWWSAPEYNASSAYDRNIYYGNYYLGKINGNKRNGCSVRLVRD